MRRLTRLIAVFSLLLAGVVVGVAMGQGAASAAPAVQAAAGTCPKPAPYPPSPGAIVAASTTTPYTGQVIEVSGTHYCPDEDVQLYIGSRHVGTAHTDSSGAFDPAVKVTEGPGQYKLSGIGASGLSTDRDSLTLTVRKGTGSGGTSSATNPGNSSGANPGTGSSSPANPSGNSNNGLPFTGTETALLIALAVLLLIGGGYLVYAGRRRNASHG